MDIKQCTQCGEVKSLNRFTKWRGSKSGYRSYCKACNAKYMSNYYQNTTKGWYYRLLYKAKTDKMSFTLSLGDIKTLANQTDCYYCQAKMTQGVGRKHHLTDRTVDRKDNSRGYIQGNVVMACRRCNLMKGAWFTAEQALEIARQYLTFDN